MSPARSISLWLRSSASLGASLSVETKNCEARMRLNSAFEKPLFYRPVLARDDADPVGPRFLCPTLGIDPWQVDSRYADLQEGRTCSDSGKSVAGRTAKSAWKSASK